mmetsp:Transcript_12329/g.25156  ORF Transcript_12329/g.25156 Transcript_12329/m.25156 type:complete len:206 (-) Transcript_12329:478-1095(-)
MPAVVVPLDDHYLHFYGYVGLDDEAAPDLHGHGLQRVGLGVEHHCGREAASGGVHLVAGRQLQGHYNLLKGRDVELAEHLKDIVLEFQSEIIAFLEEPRALPTHEISAKLQGLGEAHLAELKAGEGLGARRVFFAELSDASEMQVNPDGVFDPYQARLVLEDALGAHLVVLDRLLKLKERDGPVLVLVDDVDEDLNHFVDLLRGH